MRELEYKIALLRTENIGLKTLSYLIQKYGDATKAYKKILNLEELYSKKINLQPLEIVFKELELLQKYGGDFYEFNEYIISYIGKKDLLKDNLISIIGSRDVSENGKIFARNIAENMVSYTTVSGFSRGVDSIIHEYSPKTIAVLPCGLSYIYPSENRSLYKKIAEEGLIISQFQFAKPPTRYSFLERDQLVASLSPSLILIEGKLNSGSFYTTKYATSINRTIYAVPGHPYDGSYKANNFFLKNGAKLLEGINDITNNNIKEDKKQYYETSFDESLVKEVIKLIEKNYKSSDIIRAINISPLILNSILTEMSIFYPSLYCDLFYF